MTLSDVDERVRLGNAIVEPSLNRITVNGDAVRIPKRDMDVLFFLMRSEMKVVSRHAVLDDVWSDVIVTDDALTLSISRLRKAFGDDPKDPRIIETIPKRGYRLMITPQVCEARPPSVFSKPSFWITTLGVLLVLVTILFVLLRVEYQRLGDLREHTAVSNNDG